MERILEYLKEPKYRKYNTPQLESLYVLLCMWTALSLSKVVFLIYTSFWINPLNSPSLQTGLHCFHMYEPEHGCTPVSESVCFKFSNSGDLT